MSDLASAFVQFASAGPLLWMILGVSLGITVGAIPGLTGAMLISLTLPLTFQMGSSHALVLLVSMYVGSISGGLITATLLRMPGTPASIMTTLDGYPLAQQGRAGRALGLGIAASFTGGVVSWVFLVLLARPMAVLSTEMTRFEFFSLVLMALVLIASVSGRSLLKGILSGLLGMFVALPGLSPADGQPRLTFGVAALYDGFHLLPVLIGLFAVSQVIKDILSIGQKVERIEMSRRGIWLTARDGWRHAVNLIRSSLVGTWIGILPGIGANIGSVVAYSMAKGMSSHPDQFGKGSEEGIVASEAANNATIGGALIPLIAMGIPGSVIDAILLGALVIHNVQPGPLLFTDNPEIVYTIMATFLVANIFMFLFMTVSVGWLARLVHFPRSLLIPAILVFCVVGSYALNNRMFDVWVMLAFGTIGFGLEWLKIPLAPFVIGLVLAPEAERALATALQLSGGSYWPLLTDRFSPIFLTLALVLAIWPWIRRRRARE